MLEARRPEDLGIRGGGAANAGPARRAARVSYFRRQSRSA